MTEPTVKSIPHDSKHQFHTMMPPKRTVEMSTKHVNSNSKYHQFDSRMYHEEVAMQITEK